MISKYKIKKFFKNVLNCFTFIPVEVGMSVEEIKTRDRKDKIEELLNT